MEPSFYSIWCMIYIMSILKVYKYQYYFYRTTSGYGNGNSPFVFFLHFCHFLLAGEEGSSEVAGCHVRIKEVSSMKCLGWNLRGIRFPLPLGEDWDAFVFGSLFQPFSMLRRQQGTSLRKVIWKMLKMLSSMMFTRTHSTPLWHLFVSLLFGIATNKWVMCNQRPVRIWQTQDCQLRLALRKRKLCLFFVESLVWGKRSKREMTLFWTFDLAVYLMIVLEWTG